MKLISSVRSHTWHIQEEMYIVYWWENLKERDSLEDLGIDERVVLKCILKKLDANEMT